VAEIYDRTEHPARTSRVGVIVVVALIALALIIYALARSH
jgi:hypothetical protein